MTLEDHQLWKAVRELTRRVNLLEELVHRLQDVPQKHNDFAGPYPRRDQLPDNIPQFMEPNTRITN